MFKELVFLFCLANVQPAQYSEKTCFEKFKAYVPVRHTSEKRCLEYGIAEIQNMTKKEWNTLSKKSKYKLAGMRCFDRDGEVA
jgi:hypothetical protein